MNHLNHSLRAVLAALLLAGCAHRPAAPMGVLQPATTTPAPSAQPETPKVGGHEPEAAKAKNPIYYIQPDAVDMASLLPAPSPTQSPITRGEADLLLGIRAMADDAARQRMKSEDNFTSWTYADVLGPGFTKEKYPLTAKLLKKAESDSANITRQAKDLWSRPRPAKQDPRVPALLDLPDSFSYPSGHSTRAMMWARILGELSPTKKEALRERARLVALDRVIAGVHYPTDVAAGMALGDAIADALMKSDAFKKDFDAARGEFR